EVHAEVLQRLEKDPQAELGIDLAAQSLTLPGGRTVSFPVDPFSKTCLLQGVDELGYLLGYESQIAEFERRTGRAAS
ncbi:MAG TPA: 3-isopropylmalate dehydratase small subunit, partial [Vicinamibacteria bacterium]|nr:3-isopropylmalate dehydratase small subunit [Vicinamibacteria bacterium]